MSKRLGGRVALVTGGSKGIGKAISFRLAAEGAAVLIAARATDCSGSVKDEIVAAGGNAMALVMDVTDAASVSRGMAVAQERFGRLDILVSNAGGAITYGSFDELSDEAWQAVFELNVLGMVHVMRDGIPLLKSSATPRAICISSISGIQPGFFNPHYAAMKAATINLSKSLSKAYAADGIRINTICPGPVHSDAWDRNVASMATAKGVSLAEAHEAFEASERAKIPLGRVGEGDDIAGLVAFLASDEGDWITGSCFHINGGKLAAMV